MAFGFVGNFTGEESVIWKTEGLTDALALMSLGLPEGHTAVCNACGAGETTGKDGEWFLERMAGKEVFVIHDCDKPGQEGAIRPEAKGKRWRGWAKEIGRYASAVRNIVLPYPIEEKHGKDLRDWIGERQAEGKSGPEIYAELLAFARGLPVIEKLAIDKSTIAKANRDDAGDDDEMKSEDGRPRVEMQHDESKVSRDVVSCLAKLGWDSPWIPRSSQESAKVYVRAGRLTDAIERESADGISELIMRSLPQAIVRERITQACEVGHFVEVEGERQFKPKRPEKWLIEAIHHRGNYGGEIRPLSGIIQSPTIRPNGTILQEPGYDSATGLLYRPSGEFRKIRDDPSRADAIAAIESLHEVVVDFPFQDAADRSAWICLVLSMIGRSSVVGCVPMFGITANITRAGKGKLFQLASVIAMGRDTSITTFPQREEELAKVITSVAIEGAPVVLFDNMTTRVGGDSLDAVLTSRTWKGRILAKSETTGELPMRTIWCATGNNLQFGSDMAGRVIPIRLMSEMENPEERTGFVHSDIDTWVRVNRSRLAIDALTILRAYFVAGCPVQPGGAFGGFDEWSRIIRGAVVWAGQQDPMETRASAKENDENKYLLGLLIAGLESADPERNGLTTKEIGDRIHEHDSIDGSLLFPELSEAADQICPGKFNGRAFAKKLASFSERIYEGKRIRKQSGHRKTNRWLIVSEILDDENKPEPPEPPISSQNLRVILQDSSGDLQCKPPDGGFGGLDQEVLRVERIGDVLLDSESAYGAPPPGNPPEPPKPPCPQCGGVMEGAELVNGWRNWDCRSCGFVQPKNENE
ncbi:MAG: hypothetical protein ACF788_01245 [Novipirellula sp. JB048]